MAADQTIAPRSDGGAIEDWLHGIRAGDETAFNQFYDAFSGRLYRYLFTILPTDEDLVRDAFQETMLRVVRYAKPIDTEDDVWRWLTRLGRSALYDLLRKRTRASEREKNWDRALPGPEPADERLQAALDTALAQLDADERELIEAFYFERNSQSGLAERFGTTRKAVESRLARIRAKMRRQLKSALCDE